MLINTSSTGFRVAKLVLGTAAGIGGGVLAAAALKNIPVGEIKKYQEIGVKVAVVTLAWGAAEFANRNAVKQIDDIADLVNQGGELVKSTKVKVTSDGS